MTEFINGKQYKEEKEKLRLSQIKRQIKKMGL